MDEMEMDTSVVSEEFDDGLHADIDGPDNESVKEDDDAYHIEDHDDGLESVEEPADKSEEEGSQPPKRSRAQERIRGLIEQNKTLAKELESLRSGTALGEEIPRSTQNEQKAGLPPETANHPAIRQAELDENGNVLHQGAAVTPQFAKKQHELETEINKLKSWIQEQEQSKLEAEHRAQLQAVQQELMEAVISSIRNEREAAFPHLDNRQSERVDRQLLVLVDDYVTKGINEGREYSAELIKEATKTALNDLKETFGIFGARQLQDNAEILKNYRIKPIGMPGVPAPKPLDKMTKQERERFADKAAKAAEAMRITRG